MAGRSTTERTIKTKLDGESTGGLERAARAQARELEKLRRTAEKEQDQFNRSLIKGADKSVSALASVTKGVLAVGSAVSSAQGIAGATVALAGLSGSLLALPGVALAGAAGVGVLKLATAGFMDVIQAEDLEEFNKLTKDMAPNAVDAARAIRDQSGRLGELRRTVQGNFFADFDDDVRSLADKYFPILNKQSGAIATEFNAMGRSAAKALLAPEAVDDVNSILGSTKDTLKEMRPALADIITGVLDLGGVGAQKTTLLGRSITKTAAEFRKWVAEGVKSGEINKLIDEGVDDLKNFGRALGNVAQIGGKLWEGMSSGERDFFEGLVETTQAIEDFLDSAEGQAALRTLADTLGTTADVAREVFGTALREAGKLIVDLGPAAQGFATGVGQFLVTSIETVGPLLQGLARFLSENKDVVERLTPVILGLAVAYKGLRIATEVQGWISGLNASFVDTEKKANAAGAAIGDEKGKGGLVGRLGGLKAIAGTLALAAAAEGLNEINQRAAESGEKLGPVEDTLSNIVDAGEALLSLDFRGIFSDLIDEVDQVGRKFANGESPLGRIIVGDQTKVNLEIVAAADISQAQRDLNDLIAEIGRSNESVTVNGNTRPAALALRDIVAAIEAGDGTVNINGSNIDAHRALDDVIDQINRSSGTVRVDGNDVPAGQVLLGLTNRVNGTRAQMHIDAETSSAQGVIDGFIRKNDGRTVQIFTSVLGSGGLASAGRLAGGGRPFFSGPVKGPGTRTSDTAGLFALSNDEHVLTGAEVHAAGGHAGVFRLRQMLRTGQIRGFADGGTPRYTSSMPSVSVAPPPISVAAPNTTVAVYIDGHQFRGIVRTEIEQDKREAKRVARSGPGGGWS